MATQTAPNFAELLASAVMTPGTVATCYRAFWNYSLMNQLSALGQCEARGIAPGPIASFMGWKDKGRFVKKGERAITLCMPVNGKRTATVHDDASGQDEEKEIGYTYKRMYDEIHAALCGNALNNDVANFLADLAVRLRKLEDAKV